MTKNIEYNSQRENLVISEYGRHVQNLIRHAKTIEDKDERQRFIEGVIDLMYQMNPQAKNMSEVKEKLWKHAFRISGYDLDVTPPDGIVLSQADIELKPETIDYPKHVRKNRHYGSYIQEMINKAIALDDEEKQKEFFALIASYMKLAYKTWNKEHYANDETIKEDLKKMTGRKFDFIDDLSLDLLNISPSLKANSKKFKSKSNNYKKSKSGRRRRRRK